MAKLLNASLSGNKNILVEKTLAQLMSIDPASVRAGTSFLITDYGVTIAESDGTKWRLGWLYSTWGSKPEASLVPPGTDLRATDLNNARFFSDGVNWRPVGKQTIYHKNGLVTSPLATMSGVTAGLFAIPQILIPAGMIIPNSKIEVQCAGRKIGANATSTFQVYLGTTGTTNDSPFVSLTTGSVTLMDSMINGAAKFGTNTEKCLIQNYVGEGTSFGAASAQADRSANINTASNMYVSIAVTSANALDSFTLTSIRVSYEV